MCLATTATAALERRPCESAGLLPMGALSVLRTGSYAAALVHSGLPSAARMHRVFLPSDACAALDTRCALARAIYLHSRLYSEKTRELYQRAGLARALRRGRRGRPPRPLGGRPYRGMGRGMSRRKSRRLGLDCCRGERSGPLSFPSPCSVSHFVSSTYWPHGWRSLPPDAGFRRFVWDFRSRTGLECGTSPLLRVGSRGRGM